MEKVHPSLRYACGRWLGLSTCLVLVVGMSFTLRWSVNWIVRGKLVLMAGNGAIGVFWTPESRDSLFTSGVSVDRRYNEDSWVWWISTSKSGNWNFLSIPLWLPLLAAAIPTCLWWRAYWRRPRPGCCQFCKYDLAGTRIAVCPECGKEVR
jgi:hypothetical protein